MNAHTGRENAEEKTGSGGDKRARCRGTGTEQPDEPSRRQCHHSVKRPSRLPLE